MGEVLGINFTAIEFIFDIYGIIDPYERRLLFEKIQLVDNIRWSQAKMKANKKTDN